MRWRFWLAFLAYALLSIGTATAATFPLLFQISMANAFGPGRASPMVYIAPLLLVTVGVIPPLALLPKVRPSTARKIVTMFFGFPLLVITIVAISTLFRPPASLTAPFSGFMCLLLLLLWMRVDELRRAATREPNEDSMAVASGGP